MIKVRLGGGTLGATVEGVLYGIQNPAPKRSVPLYPSLDGR